MAPKKYLVRLTAADRTQLTRLLTQGAAPARQLTRAHILLLSDEGQVDSTIATMLHSTPATVARTRRKFVAHDLAYALTERVRVGGQATLNEVQVAHLVARACSAAPTDGGVSTMHLLANWLIETGLVDGISDETIPRPLKKTRLMCLQR